MPASKRPGWVPKYRRHRSSGQAYVSIDGRDHWLGAYDSAASKTLYERMVGEYLVGGRQPPSSPAGSETLVVTVEQVLAAFWRYAKGVYPRQTRLVFRASLRPVRRLYGAVAITDFKPVCLRAVQKSLAEQVEEGTDRSRRCRKTVNEYIARIRQVFKWGVGEGLVPAEVWHGLTAIRGLAYGRSTARETDPVGPVADAVVDATLPHLPAVVTDMVRLQRLTGMRPAEVCAMTMRDLDMSGEVWVYRPRRHKTAHQGKVRLVPIGPKAQAVLSSYLRTALDAPLFSPGESERRRLAAKHAKRATPMTPSQTARAAAAKTGRRSRLGTAYTTASYRRAVTRACVAAEVEAWSPNQLRHSRATEIRRAYGLDGAGAVLGHSKLETTQVYAERSAELAAEIARATG